MTDFTMMPALKKKRSSKSTKAQKDGEVSLDLGMSFSVEDAKESDFDIDLDSAKYVGKKGQAGTRTKSS